MLICFLGAIVANHFFESAFVVNNSTDGWTLAVATWHAHTLTPHRTPHPRPPPPRLTESEGDGKMEQPEERSETNTYGRSKSCTTRCPAFLTFRDSPAAFV